MRVDMARVDPDANMDRFYCVVLTESLFGEIGVERQWGRCRTHGRRRLDWYGNETKAKTALTNLVKHKLSRGYLMKPQGDGQ